MRTYEYASHVIPLQPGPGNATDAVLNRCGGDGWRVASTHLVATQHGSPLDPRAQQGMALFVLLEREVPGPATGSGCGQEPVPYRIGGVALAVPGGAA